MVDLSIIFGTTMVVGEEHRALEHNVEILVHS